MKAGVLILGIIGSAGLGLFASKGLINRDYSGSVSGKSGNHDSCPTLWVIFDKAPDVVPEGMILCKCPVQAEGVGEGKPIHPPRELVDAAATADQLTVSYTEFSSPFGGKKVSGLSYGLMRGTDRQSFPVSPSWNAYSKFALLTLTPFLVGAILAVVLVLLPSKRGA